MREPKLGVAIGKKGVGKTWETRQTIYDYVTGANGLEKRRALIFDVNDEFEDYPALALKDIVRFCAHPTIEARRIRPIKENGETMTIKELQKTLFVILRRFRGGLLLIEDLNRYVSDNLPNDVVGAICTNRHRDADIILHFQSIGRITPKIWQNINWLRMHKITDTVDYHRKKFEDKYIYLRLAEMIINYEYYKKNNIRYHLYADIDSEKVRGEIDPAVRDMCIDNFIAENYRRYIAPLVNRTPVGNMIRHDEQSAYQEVKSNILEHFEI